MRRKFWNWFRKTDGRWHLPTSTLSWSTLTIVIIFFSILNKNNNLTHNAVRCGVELPFSLLTATGNSMPSLSRWLEFHRNWIFSLGFSIVSLGGHTL